MKGFFFAKPLEYRIECEGENFHQGDALTGKLTVTNRGKEIQKKVVLSLGLSYGDFKKIKKNEADAFVPVERFEISEAMDLKPEQEHQQSWNISLPHDCPVTSNEGGLFLIYGRNLDESGSWSRLDLPVSLSPCLSAFVAVIENHFAFAVKSTGFENGFTEITFKPPSSYPTVEELGVGMKINQDGGMDIQFDCRLKKLDRGVGKGLIRESEVLNKTISAGDLKTEIGQPNRKLYQQIFAGILSDVAPPPMKKGK